MKHAVGTRQGSGDTHVPSIGQRDRLILRPFFPLAQVPQVLFRFETAHTHPKLASSGQRSYPLNLKPALAMLLLDFDDVAGIKQ